MAILQPIPTQIKPDGKQVAEGFVTPKGLDTKQIAGFRPERVIPVIFLPGIMGSHLRFCAGAKGQERQRRLGKKNNVAWRPDDKVASGWSGLDDPAERQLRLDPEVTVVDIYDPKTHPTGNRKESADDRHDNVNKVYVPPDSPMLMDDPCTRKKGKSGAQKARERGWSEVMFSSYGQLLNRLELRLNLAFRNNKLNRDWSDIIGVDPKQWQLSDKTPQSPLSEADLRKVVSNCYYPVHALGYNWLQSNGVAAKEIAKRIQSLMADYRKKGFKCEKVIIVTHSMGGLVGRALCHPDYGNLQNEILGIVHGEMPAIGAAAAYRRMRAGFEGGGIADWVIGNQGSEVTPVLANAVGGLQLLPCEAYGNDWLKIVGHNGEVLKSLPKNGDPYEEIYKRTDVWWGLLREPWINPAGNPKCGAAQTKKHLEKAQEFHQKLKDTFHPLSYAHYGCDAARPAYQTVTWHLFDPATGTTTQLLKAQAAHRSSSVPPAFPLNLPLSSDTALGHRPGNGANSQSSRLSVSAIDALRIVVDDTQGILRLSDDPTAQELTAPSPLPNANLHGSLVQAYVSRPSEPGDQTVPMHSAEYLATHGGTHFKGIFRQTGYEHQDSYQDTNAIAATLYSIVRIAQQMEWKKTP